MAEAKDVREHHEREACEWRALERIGHNLERREYAAAKAAPHEAYAAAIARLEEENERLRAAIMDAVAEHEHQRDVWDEAEQSNYHHGRAQLLRRALTPAQPSPSGSRETETR